MRFDVGFSFLRRAMYGDQMMQPVVRTTAEHIGLVGAAEARHRLHKGVEDRLELGGRTADGLEHVCGGGLLLQRLPQFLEQPRILDGDHGLLREVAE